MSAEDGKCAMGITRPAQWWLNEVLAGRIHMDAAPVSVRSWARFPIFQGAREIVLMETQDERKAELAKVPPLIRPWVEIEVKRIWGMRREL